MDLFNSKAEDELGHHHHLITMMKMENFPNYSNLPSPPPTTVNSLEAATRDMVFRIAAMQPVINIDRESMKPPAKRRNVQMSTDPQSVAARHRRERISEKIRILRRMVPGGTRMDTAAMLDEAVLYVQFLKTQILSLQNTGLASPPPPIIGMGFPVGLG